MTCSTFYDVLRLRAEHQPEQIACTYLIYGDEEAVSLTYAELDRQAKAIAAMLQEYAMFGERVLLLYPPCLEFLPAFFGCIYAGAMAVPAYPPRPNHHLSRIPAIIRDSGATLALTLEKTRSNIAHWFAKEVAPSLRIITTDRLDRGLETAWHEPKIMDQSVVFLQYTSGSTAIPKGVMISHSNLLANSAMIYRAFGHNSDSVGVSWLPTFHDMGLIGGILQPLYGGFPVILMPPSAFIQRPLRWLKAISTYRATTSGGPNFGYELCVNRIASERCENLDLSSWEVAFNGAEPVHHETLENFVKTFEPYGFRKEACYPCYGLAEATLFVTGSSQTAWPVIQTFKESALENDHLIETERADKDARTIVGCGTPPPELTLKIVCPDTFNECPPNHVGEIWIAGPIVAQGYWNRPEDTEQTFRASPTPTPSQEGNRGISFLRTGDLGFLKDGELFITGRLKDLIIIRGRNHYPEDIEWRIGHCHPLIRQEGCAVFTVPVAGEERLVVIAEVESSYWDRRRKSRKNSYTGIERRRPPHLQPTIPRIKYVEEAITCVRKVVADHHELQVYGVFLVNPGTIPKTSSGKIQRHRCKARYTERTMDVLASSVLEMASGDQNAIFLDRSALLAEAPEKRQRRMESFLQHLIAAVLKIAPNQVNRQQSLNSLGIDSLMAVELQHRLETSLGLHWPMARFLDRPTIAGLATAILQEFGATATAPKPGLTATHLRGNFPLSYNQRALWYLYKLDRTSAAYNVLFAMRIRSHDVDIPALQRAFQHLVDRHEALRTTYCEYDGEPIQQVHAHWQIPFEEFDASAWDDERMNQQLADTAHRPFDLENEPVLRLTFLNKSAGEHILLLTVHHIAVDFWSLLVMMDELQVLYPAERRRSLPYLPLHTLSYGDVVRWQTEMVNGPEGERLWAYWQKQLAGELPVLNLPTDHPRPPVQTYRGAAHTFKLSQELTNTLHALSQQAETTLYMTLLAAFQVLLHRYTGQDDLLVGAPTAGRKFAEFDDLVGYFVNPVVLRADLSGNPAFITFLQQVRQTVLDALEHQYYPFQILVERLRIKRDASHSPIFQVMFVMEKPHRLDAAAPFALREAGGKINLGGLEVESLAIEQRIAQFDLTLMMVETEDGLAASLEYNTDLFDPATINRMAGHFRTLLAGIVAHPEQRISELPILTETERHQILVAWNDTTVEYPKNKCIHELFEEQAERTPDAVAVIFGHQKLTYRELNARANQLAHYLRKLGIGPEILVGICVERSLEMIIGILGILKAGGAYVPLDLAYPKDRIAFMLEDCQTPILLTQYRLVENLPPSQAQIVCLDKDWGVIAQEAQENPVSETSPDNLTYVIYTSGSTGKSKGTLISHYNVVRLFQATQSWFNFNEQDVWTLFHSYAFDFSVWELWGALLYGGKLIIVPYWISRSPEAFYQLLCDEGVTILNQTPSAFRQLIAVEEDLDSIENLSLRFIIFGGEALELQSLKPWLDRHGDQNPQLINMYGITETTVHVTYRPITIADVRDAVGSLIGIPITDLQVYILDKHLQLVPIGVPGELCVSGGGVARGYLNRDTLTTEKFILNPFLPEPKTKLYRSGDLARYLPNKDIEYLGRIDQQVKIRGFRIELGEIETVLVGHPNIRESVVLVHEDKPESKKLVAYLVPEQEAELVINELRGFLKEKLPEYMVPSAFVVLEAFPLTPNGKIDRRALPAPDFSHPKQEGDYVTPRTTVEETLTSIWKEVLKLERISVYDNFFDLGGDSIISIRIVSRAQQAGINITPKDLLQYQTIAGLAAVAEPLPRFQTLTKAEPFARMGSFPLTPVQQWFFEQNFVEQHHWNQAILLELLQPLDPTRLEEAIHHVIAHHDEFRLRFRRKNADWEQEYTSDSDDVPFSQCDLSRIPKMDQDHLIKVEATKLQVSLHISEGPLIRIVLFDLGAERPQYLFLVIHHLVVDGVSWRILLEDIETVYRQLRHREQIVLPSKTTSFKHWGAHLQNAAQSATITNELRYWLSIFSHPGVSNLDLAAKSTQLQFDTPDLADQVFVSLSAEQTHTLLHKVPQTYHTQINDVLLTALTQAYTRWTGQRALLIDLEGHGRTPFSEDIDVSRTIGWFTTIFPVLLALDTDHPGEALKSIKEQLRRVPNQGMGYGLLRYLNQDEAIRQKIRKLPHPEILFNYLGQFDHAFSPSALFKPVLTTSKLTGPLRSPKGRRSHLLEINGLITEGKLHVSWTYNRNIHARQTIAQLAQDFLDALEMLIAHCLSPEGGGYTPSDFPAARLNQQQLEKIMHTLKQQK